MRTNLRLALSAVALLLATGTALSETRFVPGQKIDSGLGELPHYSLWTDPAGRTPLSQRVLGESLDDGLGHLPHYSKWQDRSGRDPLGLTAVLALVAKR